MTDADKAIDEAKAGMLPYESWEQLPRESPAAFAAFCAFRDCGLERSIRRAADGYEKDESKRDKRYRVWRSWCSTYRWRERAADYDRYLEKLKQGELRKTIEAQGEMHRAVTGKMLEVVSKKLDLMDPAELTQGNVAEWVQTAIKVERETIVSSSGRPELKQGELTFTSDFDGL